MPRIKIKDLQAGDIFAFLRIEGGPSDHWSLVKEIRKSPARPPLLKIVYSGSHTISMPGVQHISPEDSVWKDNRRKV